MKIVKCVAVFILVVFILYVLPYLFIEWNIEYICKETKRLKEFEEFNVPIVLKSKCK